MTEDEIAAYLALLLIKISIASVNFPDMA